MCGREQYIGKKYGRWTVICFSHRASGKRQMYVCRCDCGTVKPVSIAAIKHGHTISCGCLQKEKTTTHGGTYNANHKKQRLYRIYEHMKYRCTNPRCVAYKNYGGRGIEFAEEWRNYENFRQWALTHGYAENLTLDRIDVNSDYCPENCRWITAEAQHRNRRDNVFITLGNKTQCVSEWCRELGINTSTVYNRIKSGCTLQDALLKPIKKRRKKCLI